MYRDNSKEIILAIMLFTIFLFAYFVVEDFYYDFNWWYSTYVQDSATKDMSEEYEYYWPADKEAYFEFLNTNPEYVVDDNLQVSYYETQSGVYDKNYNYLYSEVNSSTNVKEILNSYSMMYEMSYDTVINYNVFDVETYEQNGDSLLYGELPKNDKEILIDPVTSELLFPGVDPKEVVGKTINIKCGNNGSVVATYEFTISGIYEFNTRYVTTQIDKETQTNYVNLNVYIDVLDYNEIPNVESIVQEQDDIGAIVVKDGTCEEFNFDAETCYQTESDPGYTNSLQVMYRSASKMIVLLIFIFFIFYFTFKHKIHKYARLTSLLVIAIPAFLATYMSSLELMYDHWYIYPVISPIMFITIFVIVVIGLYYIAMKLKS